jgi:hypothetical protein
MTAASRPEFREAAFIRQGYPHAFIHKPVQELMTPDFKPAAGSLAALWKE